MEKRGTVAAEIQALIRRGFILFLDAMEEDGELPGICINPLKRGASSRCHGIFAKSGIQKMLKAKLYCVLDKASPLLAPLIRQHKKCIYDRGAHVLQ